MTSVGGPIDGLWRQIAGVSRVNSTEEEALSGASELLLDIVSDVTDDHAMTVTSATDHLTAPAPAAAAAAAHSQWLDAC